MFIWHLSCKQTSCDGQLLSFYSQYSSTNRIIMPIKNMSRLILDWLYNGIQKKKSRRLFCLRYWVKYRWRWNLSDAPFRKQKWTRLLRKLYVHDMKLWTKRNDYTAVGECTFRYGRIAHIKSESAVYPQVILHQMCFGTKMPLMVRIRRINQMKQTLTRNRNKFRNRNLFCKTDVIREKFISKPKLHYH